MDNEVIAAWITAGGTVVAALIGVAGVYSILKHRRKVQLLSEEVEAYHHHEGQLTRAIYRLRNSNAELTDAQLSVQRGKLRSEFATDIQKPSMTASKAVQLRKQIL